ncbi:RnfABCDGE type electron transport complex subunit B [uncultured Ruminococcus sp.]|uniref:RnfABCDGE type electron transport complex subunit B n=1 Tax=uncultured Ruminococcus sp. TaxID=165186 RepID=UPI00292D29BE|nr:RnfABCDGE type electron transport complex subunit B [uncultured Ruminococcus sp.]
MTGILLAVGIVAGIGLLIGLILSIASIIMAVPKDEKAEAILEALPGANCGACGFSGCSGYAEALAKGKAEPGLCAPGGLACTKAVSEILGVETGSVEPKVAVVKCMGSLDHTTYKAEYSGIMSCAAAMKIGGGLTACSYGCMGLGDCEAACPYDAIHVNNGVAYVDGGKCRACTLCVKACPRGIIEIVPKKDMATVRCSNHDKGGVTRKLCDIGCIGCKKCEKACEQGAVKVTDFCAYVTPALCTNCGACVDACPQHCITFFKG